MSSNALTIVIPIQPSQEKVEELDKLLSEIGDDIDNKKGNHISFAQLTTTHFLRWVILPEDTKGKRHYPPQLAFESNFDGPVEEHLDELIRVGGPVLARIYGYCVGCPPDVADNPVSFRRFLLRPRLSRVHEAAFYRAYPNHTVQHARGNTGVRLAIQDLLDDPKRAASLRGLEPEHLCQELRNHLATVPGLKMERDPEPPPTRMERFVRLLVESRPVQVAVGVPAVLLLLPVLLPATALLLWKEFRDEARDEVEPKTRDVVDARVEGQEDHLLQNQLTHLVEIRPGLFRQLTLRGVLGGINFLARHYFNRGELGGIPTIHFARWVIIDGGRRLLFFSNYDGSWERYLGDFIDQAAVGLTGVWSNTRGYPKTRLLFFKGATNEEDFKQWARDHQVFTQVWYSAHVNESVGNILQNVAVCAKLNAELKSKEAEQWLLKL